MSPLCLYGMTWLFYLTYDRIGFVQFQCSLLPEFNERQTISLHLKRRYKCETSVRHASVQNIFIMFKEKCSQQAG